MHDLHRPCFVLATNTAPGSSASIPLPTAYGYPASYIPVIDYMSIVYSGTATAGAGSAWGGWMRVNVRINGTSNTYNVLSLSTPLVTYPVGTASSNYILMGAVEHRPFNGTPLYPNNGAGASDPGTQVTSTQIQINSGGTFPTTGASENVEYNVVFHYENPAERR